MATHNCENCSFRGKYDKRPTSLLGRLWKWHTGWCPGWKKYVNSLEKTEKEKLQQKYQA